ncbi:hypothetical protein [Deinococcus sp. NW-56]|uniref:hypothetical protein n=1 Tax=Deinococcus sp. NW-56 TaxID=2080419 RepID=UPI001319E21D|nr:hypothetical protein [Deinococcus sp. NW-56]
MTTSLQGPASALPTVGTQTWRLQVLGHVALCDGDDVVPLFHKGLALVTYLVLEGRAHHREHLAALLWDTPDALGNLRVELLRLRRRGVGLLPPRQPMLSLRCRTDLDDWEAAPDDFRSECEVLEWLSPLRGPALSGLEDLGTTAFHDWLDSQRSALHDRVEARLARAASVLAARGDQASVRLIAARAEALGLELGSVRPAQETPVLWPAQQARWREVLGRARHQPQLVLLHGEAGTRREMLDTLVRGSAWQTVQVHAGSGGPLCCAALGVQLRRLLPPGSGVPRRPEPDSLLELAELLGAVTTPLLLVLHDPSPDDPWWVALIGTALDLPSALTVVVTDSAPTHLNPRPLAPLLRRVAGPRLHVLALLPLGVEEVSRMLQARDSGPEAPAPDDGLAAQLVQCTEGSLPYLQALLERDPPVPDYRLPAPVAELLLAGLAARPAAERHALARLAQVYGPITPDLAAAVLGPEADDRLALGVRLGLLVPVEATETLHLPDLSVRTPDGAAALGFAHELTRCALAATLPAHERDALRRDLARALLPGDPARSLLYAERTGDPELRERARAALPALPASPLRGQGPCPVPATSPPPGDQPRQEHRTPGGYRVLAEHGLLRVLRRGHPGPSPLLVLKLGAGDAVPGVVARVDLLPAAPRPDQWPPEFALGLRVEGGPRLLYTSGPVPPHEVGGVPHVYGGLLPLGRWVCLNVAPGRVTELSVRSQQVALTLAAPALTRHHR